MAAIVERLRGELNDFSNRPEGILWLRDLHRRRYLGDGDIGLTSCATARRADRRDSIGDRSYESGRAHGRNGRVARGPGEAVDARQGRDAATRFGGELERLANEAERSCRRPDGDIRRIAGGLFSAPTTTRDHSGCGRQTHELPYEGHEPRAGSSALPHRCHLSPCEKNRTRAAIGANHSVASPVEMQ